MTTEPFIIERTFSAPANLVWQAISDPEKMKAWYFDIKDFKAVKGHKFQFSGGSKEKTYLHLCEVMEVVPGRRLSYSWAYNNYPGKSLVTFELFPEGDKTRLKLIHAGLETFPKDNKDFAQESFTAGWNQIIGKNLKEYVERTALV